jgi:hypothetical protein
MYTTEDLKSLSDFLKLTAKEALKEEPSREEDHHEIMAVVRQLEALRFNPLLFQSLLEGYDLPFSLMEDSLDQVALHINDAGVLSKALVQWRCTNGI